MDRLPSIDALSWFTRLEIGDPLIGWHLLVAEDPTPVADEVAATFELFSLPVLTLAAGSPTFEDWLKARPETERVTVLTGLGALDSAALGALDLRRERLQVVAPFLVMCAPKATAELIARHAPNLFSFVAETTSRWEEARDEAASAQWREAELTRLRSDWGLSDAELIERAERDELPAELRAETDLYLWLALLGRGDFFDRWRAADAD